MSEIPSEQIKVVKFSGPRFLKNVALGFTGMIGAFCLLQGWAFVKGACLENFFEVIFLTGCLMAVVVVGFFVTLYAKQYGCILGGCLGIVAICYCPKPRFDPYMAGLKYGISRKVDLREIKSWVFAQDLTDGGRDPMMLHGPRHRQYQWNEVPETITRPFSAQKRLNAPIFVREETSGRNVTLGMIGFAFTSDPPEEGYEKIGDGSFVFVHMRK